MFFKRNQIAALIMSSFLSASIFASSKNAKSSDETAEEEESVTATKSPYASGVDGESAAARLNKVAGVAFRCCLTIGLIPGSGFDAFYNKGPDWQFGIQYTRGKVDLKSAVGDTVLTKTDKLEVTSQTIAGTVRYFFGNSFNIYGQLGQRVIGWDFKVSSKSSIDSVSSKGKTTSTYFGVGIGNTWAWDNGFFIGGDWFGYFVPLSSSSSTSTETTGTVSSDIAELQKNSEDLGKGLGRTNHTQLAMLNIGFMF